MLKTINETTKKAFLTKFGEHIKQLRQERDLNHTEFARRCYTNVRKISRTEKGEYDFKISSLIALAKGLDVSITELLEFEYPENLFETFWSEELPHPEKSTGK